MSEDKKKKDSGFPFKVDHSKTQQPEEQKKLQKQCTHHDADTDISLVDGNHPDRKSTLISGYCPVCGYTENKEI